jgi:uncharacterized protein (TIGR02145 family)
MLIPLGVVMSIAVSLAAGPVSSKRMADGKQWTTRNLDLDIAASYCYDDAEQHCRQYGRLYTWESARRGCESLGNGWRLPTNDEWRLLAAHYGGLLEESEALGKAAFTALVNGGPSGFNVVFGGGRAEDGQYARRDGHGFYWTASESDAGHAWFYNFGQMHVVNRHRDGEKQRALSVRCIKD